MSTTKISREDTVLTDFLEMSMNNVYYAPAQEKIVPAKTEFDNDIIYHTIPVGIRNCDEDDTIGELIIPGPGELFSYGISKNVSKETGITSGYSMSFSMWNRDCATPDQVAWTDKMEEFVEHTKQHLITPEVKASINNYELAHSDLRKLTPLYWKKEKGERIEGVGPSMYAKLICFRDKDNTDQWIFLTELSTPEGEDVDPLTLVSTKTVKNFCKSSAAYKIESIYIGNSISIQLKLYEAEVNPMSTTRKSFIRKQKPVKKIVMMSAGGSNPMEEESPKEAESDKKVKKVKKVKKKAGGEEEKGEVKKVKKKVKKVKKPE
jgi:hypothetical protein